MPKPDFVKTQKQCEAVRLLASGALHIMLLGGSRSGKTAILIRQVIIRACKVKSNHIILRKYLSSAVSAIWLRTLPFVLQAAFPNVKVHWNNKYYYITFPNGSEIWLCGADTMDTAEKVMGRGCSTLYFNETPEITYEIISKLTSRLADKTSLKNLVFYDCNPPGTTSWIYKLFVKHLDPTTNEPICKAHLYAWLRMNPTDNAENLADNYIEDVLGTMPAKAKLRFLEGQFTDDTEGALWTLDMIINASARPKCDEKITVVGVDPAVTNNPDSDLTGIIVASSDYHDANVLADYSLRASPETWAEKVVMAFHKHEANYVVVEVNQGGDLVESVLRSIDANLPIRKVRASKGKYARAEPVAALYEKKRIHHAKDLNDLQEELMGYVPETSKKSPDRLDALVWVLYYILLREKRNVGLQML